MPVWARFLWAVTTGAALALAGAVAGAYGWYGGARFWSELWRFAASAAFWRLAVWCWALLAAVLLAVGLVRRLQRRRGPGPAASGLCLGLLATWACGLWLSGRLGLPWGVAARDLAFLGAAGGLGAAAAGWLFERL